MRLAAIVAVLGGCYSPAYDDCVVRCSGGDCPSGYMCQMPERVCRKPENVGEACPGGGSSNDAGGGTDASPDGLMLTFCQMRPDAERCHDFDSVASPDTGWSYANYEGAGGMNALVASTRSAPSAYESRMPMNVAGQLAYARLIDEFTPSTTTTQVIVAWDMNIAQRVSAQSDMEVFSAGANGYFRATARSTAGGMLRFSLDSASTQFAEFAIAMNTWVHWELIFDFLSAGEVEIFVRQEALPQISLGETQSIVPPGSTAWEASPGGHTSGVNGVATIDYDNIVVTVKP